MCAATQSALSFSARTVGTRRRWTHWGMRATTQSALWFSACRHTARGALSCAHGGHPEDVQCVPPHCQRRAFEHAQWCGMGYHRSSRGGRRSNVRRHTISTVFVRTHCGASLVISGHHHAGCVGAHVASTSSGGLVSSTHRSHDV